MTELDGTQTLGRWICDRAATTPGSIAIDDRGVLLDYKTLYERASSLAVRLAAAGYGPGHRIATVSGNSADHVVAFFACALLGIAFVPLSWRLTPVELSDLIHRSGAPLVLVEDEHAALARAAFSLMESAPATAELGANGVERRMPRCVSPRARRPVRDDDPLLVIYTSGSEAAAKGVVLTHSNCFWNNVALAQVMPITNDDVILSVLPQYHVAAWNVQPLLAWWSGATVILERSFHPSRVLQLIRDRRVTAMMGVPTQYRMLHEAPEWPDADLTSLKTVLVGGATIPDDLADAWTARGVGLTQGYGLTEAGPNVLTLPADAVRVHPGAVGRPYPYVDVCLVDPETSLVLNGSATGELWVRGPSVFSEYLDDPVATARVRVDEWLRTGDLVHRDSDGIYRVVDRIKEIYVSGGENVSPAEVERVLEAHPLVTAAAVVGVPDPVWGERGVAFIMRSGPLGEDELLGFARDRLATFKLPVKTEFVDRLPRSTIEKVARGVLRSRALQLLTEDKEDTHDPAG